MAQNRLTGPLGLSLPLQMLCLLSPFLESLIQMHLCAFLATKKYKILTLVSEEFSGCWTDYANSKLSRNFRETYKQVCKLIHNNIGEKNSQFESLVPMN